ncbi:MAG: hypothetical protein WCW66_05275 [Patescibacteria group bacterium]|jgi:hypothetical protein
MNHPFEGRLNEAALDQQALKYAQKAVNEALKNTDMIRAALSLYDEEIDAGADPKQAIHDMYSRIEEEVVKHLFEGHDLPTNEDEIEEMLDVLDNDDENNSGKTADQDSTDRRHQLAEKGHIMERVAQEYERINFIDLIKSSIGGSNDENSVEVLRRHVQ